MKLTRPSTSIVARWLLILSLITVPSLAWGQKNKSAPSARGALRPCLAPVGACLAPIAAAPVARRTANHGTRPQPITGRRPLPTTAHTTTANHGTTTTTANHGTTTTTANKGTTHHGEQGNDDDPPIRAQRRPLPTRARHYDGKQGTTTTTAGKTTTATANKGATTTAAGKGTTTTAAERARRPRLAARARRLPQVVRVERARTQRLKTVTTKSGNTARVTQVATSLLSRRPRAQRLLVERTEARESSSTRPGGGRLVNNGRHGYGYGERGYRGRDGHRYMGRTYYRGGHYYAYGYRGGYYHGGYYYGYVSPYYYGPAFYGWAYNPWAAPVVYSWGWGGAPWYGYYGYYFNPYPAVCHRSIVDDGLCNQPELAGSVRSASCGQCERSGGARASDAGAQQDASKAAGVAQSSNA